MISGACKCAQVLCSNRRPAGFQPCCIGGALLTWRCGGRGGNRGATPLSSPSGAPFCFKSSAAIRPNSPAAVQGLPAAIGCVFAPFASGYPLRLRLCRAVPRFLRGSFPKKEPKKTCLSAKKVHKVTAGEPNGKDMSCGAFNRIGLISVCRGNEPHCAAAGDSPRVVFACLRKSCDRKPRVTS